jgi:phosphoglycerate dehydrogenase-like enzyme
MKPSALPVKISPSLAARSGRENEAVCLEDAMAILMMSKYTDHYIDPEVWRAGLLKEIPDLDFRLWPHVGDLSSIDMVLADFAPKGFLKTLPNLKLVTYLGYGVDSLFKDPELPKVSITRITNPGIAKQISQYVLLYLLRQHRMLDTYLSQQLEKKWVPRHRRLSDLVRLSRRRMEPNLKTI